MAPEAKQRQGQPEGFSGVSWVAGVGILLLLLIWHCESLARNKKIKQNKKLPTSAGSSQNNLPYSDLSEAMSMEKRYFTSDFISRS